MLGLSLRGWGAVCPGAWVAAGSSCEGLGSALPVLLYIWGGELISEELALGGFGEATGLGLGPG